MRALEARIAAVAATLKAQPDQLERKLDALLAHELIKVRVNGEDREERSAAIQMIAAATKSQIVQIIGKIVLLYRPARKPNPKLSNLLRYSHLQG